jgi:type IV pilus assembly protein PilY1
MEEIITQMEIIMKKITALGILCIFSALLAPSVQAAPDQYPGDSSIYGVQAPLQPNVLLIIDDSGSMADSVPADDYKPGTTYAVANKCYDSNGQTGKPCSANAVYTVGSATDKTADGYLNASVTNITTSCGGLNPRDALQTLGFYHGRNLNTSGTCKTSGWAGNGNYATGNYINYLNTPGATLTAKIDVAKSVIKNLIAGTDNVKFGLMTFRYVSGSGEGGQLVKITSVPGAGTTEFTSEVKKMDDIFTGTITNRTALAAAVDSLSPLSNTPLGEALFEAGRYLSGGAPAFGATNGVTGGSYTAPIDATCQKNYIVLVTDGMSNADNSAVLKSICTSGDCDADGKEPGDLNHSLDDVAKYLNTLISYDGHPLNVVTYTIGFGLTGADQAAVDLLKATADKDHGKGGYYSAGSQTDLSAAFTTILTEIFSVNSSYVAPVVPVSPENRTYGGSRIYMGFFKPTNANWLGNLKKYGIDANSNIVDVNGSYATWEDKDGDGFDDRPPHPALLSGTVNGSFRTTAKSFWSNAVDGGNVDAGGVGALLQSTSAASRKIYTLAPSGSGLIELNQQTTSGIYDITPAMLGVADTTASGKLINYIYGQDAYDADGNGNTTENRDWIMGDVLHSRPVIVNYAKFTTANESNCSKNKSLIFVGSNDGMLHAFRDCDGSEAWSFIPHDVLINLKNITDANKSYYTDSTISAYLYNNDNSGNVNTTNGDKVILVFGLRRGGGTAAAATTGAYYALDVSSYDYPTAPAPALRWSISNSTPLSGSPATPVFSELAESWSEPKLVKMKIGSPAVNKIVAFFGAGYDNPNEDGRYGATQTFPATATGVAASSTGAGPTTSSGTSSPVSPKGRGIYAVEIATLDSTTGKPTIATPTSTNNYNNKLWSYTNSTDPAMSFSFASEIAAIDTTNSGYTNMLYAADTGGNIWRFDVGDANTAHWTGNKIFSSNPGSGGSTDVGRKIFYKPSVVTEYGYRMVFFGTGDREHPLNTDVTDRIYAVKDPGTITTATCKTESDLLDVTTDQLQTTTIPSGPGSVEDILSKLNGTTEIANGIISSGWYIKLDQNSGEKVLSPPLVFNKAAYFTTYAPGAASTDVCVAGNLGAARIYSLNYKTGEAVLNYDLTNDSGTPPNARSKNSGGGVLVRSDRVKTSGNGIPSGVVVLGSGTSLLAGAGGNLPKVSAAARLSNPTVYWRQK